MTTRAFNQYMEMYYTEHPDFPDNIGELIQDVYKGPEDTARILVNTIDSSRENILKQWPVILLLFSPHLLWLPHLRHLSFVHFTMFSSIFYPSLVLFNQLYETYYRNSHVKCQYCFICFTFVS